MNRQASGLRAWLLQRISAIVIFGGLSIFAIKLLFLPPQTLFEWRSWLAMPLVSVLLMLLVLGLLLHAWVGIRDVVIDYVSSLEYRVFVLACFAVFLVAMGLWCLQIVMSL